MVGDDCVCWGVRDFVGSDRATIRLSDIAGKLSTTQSALTCGIDKKRVITEYVYDTHEWGVKRDASGD